MDNWERASAIKELMISVQCPFCLRATHRVSHIISKGESREFGPWYCDECGKASAFKFDGKRVFVKKTKMTRTRTLVLLKLNEDRGPIYVVVDSGRFGNRDDQESCDRYRHEGGTCDVNIFRFAEVVCHKGDADSHGLFEFVASRDRPKDMDQVPWVTEKDMLEFFSLVQPMDF